MSAYTLKPLKDSVKPSKKGYDSLNQEEEKDVEKGSRMNGSKQSSSSDSSSCPILSAREAFQRGDVDASRRAHEAKKRNRDGTTKGEDAEASTTKEAAHKQTGE